MRRSERTDPLKTFLYLLLAGLLVLGLSGCASQDDSVGENLEEAADEVGDGVEETGEEMQDAAGEAADEVEDAADEAAEKVDDATGGSN